MCGVVECSKSVSKLMITTIVLIKWWWAESLLSDKCTVIFSEIRFFRIFPYLLLEQKKTGPKTTRGENWSEFFNRLIKTGWNYTKPREKKSRLVNSTRIKVTWNAISYTSCITRINLTVFYWEFQKTWLFNCWRKKIFMFYYSDVQIEPLAKYAYLTPPNHSKWKNKQFSIIWGFFYYLLENVCGEGNSPAITYVFYSREMFRGSEIKCFYIWK